MTETINQRCARLCKEWETAVAEVRAGKLSPQVAGEAYDRYAAAMAERSAAQSGGAPRLADTAERRRAETRDLWRRVIGKINAEMFGSEPDASRTDASRGAPSDTGQKPDTKSIWSKAVAKANAEMTGNEACQPPSNGRPQPRSGEFLSKSMATAGKQLEQAGFKVT